jgi:hypothetical protein
MRFAQGDTIVKRDTIPNKQLSNEDMMMLYNSSVKEENNTQVKKENITPKKEENNTKKKEENNNIPIKEENKTQKNENDINMSNGEINSPLQPKKPSAVIGFNLWALGPGMSNVVRKLNKEKICYPGLKHPYGDLNKNGIQDPGEFDFNKDKKVVDLFQNKSGYFLAPFYYPLIGVSTVVSRLVPTYVSRFEYQPLGTTVMNVENCGTQNALVNKNSFGMEFGTDLSIPKIGLLNSLSFNIDRSGYTYGGTDAGSDRNIGLSFQTLIAEKPYLDDMWKPIKKILDPFIGGNIRYSFVNNNERNVPSFYNPSVKNASFGADMYFSLGLFATISYDHSLGTKEYTLGFPHKSDDKSWTVRLDAPNLLGEGWGIPFMTLHPWVALQRGQDNIEISSGSTINTTETDPITGEELKDYLPGDAGESQIAYSAFSGGVNAYLFKDLELGVSLLKETREMQRDRRTSEYHLTYGPVTVKYSRIDNPIRYYDLNTNPTEKQNKYELEFNPRFFAGKAAQFLPSVVIGHQKTWADVSGGSLSLRDNNTYFGLKFSLGLSDKKQRKAVSNSGYASLVDMTYVPNIVGNNTYAWDKLLTEKVIRDFEKNFDKGLSDAVASMTDDAAKEQFKTSKKNEFDGLIKEFRDLVKEKGFDSDDAISKKTDIENLIKLLSGGSK